MQETGEQGRGTQDASSSLSKSPVLRLRPSIGTWGLPPLLRVFGQETQLLEIERTLGISPGGGVRCLLLSHREDMGTIRGRAQD